MAGQGGAGQPARHPGRKLPVQREDKPTPVAYAHVLQPLELLTVPSWAQVYDGFHKDHPTTPMIGSETASNNEDRGEYTDPGYVSSFDQASA